MMIDLLTWSPINLGRWAGTQVRIHIFLLLFVFYKLLDAAFGTNHLILQTACWLGLLILALALHEAAHATMAWWIDAEAEDVRLWPLGNMVVPSSASRSSDNLLVALAGPAINMFIVLIAAIGLGFLGAHFVWNPFGNAKGIAGSGAPNFIVNGELVQAAPYTLAWWIGWFGYLNWLIMLLNLIPALPFDGGRFIRAYVAQSSMSVAKDSMIPPLLARSCALILVITGVVLLVTAKGGDGLTVLSLAVLIEWMVRTEARLIDDGGFFDDGVFGYDFSEGYTSLEGSAAKVRPYRESALKRWRRRRSELRRQRRQEREAAEERRMDEILEKLHREGRLALTDEEHRFLVRVSVKYRNKPRAHD